MSTRLPHDLLSAYLDGETTPDETARVERALADSLELQRELADLREISAYVADACEEPEPVELREAVLRTIEREALIGSPMGSVVAAEPPSGPAQRNRWATIAAVVASAAVLMIAVSLFPRGNRPDSIDVVHRDGETDPTGFTRGRETADVDVPHRDMVAAGTGDEVDEPTDGDSEGRAIAAADAAPADPFVPGGGGRGGVPAPMVRAMAGIDTGLRYGDSLKSADVGEVIEALDPTGETVSVVKVVVVDRQEGMVALQRLLTSNEVPQDERAAGGYRVAPEPAIEPMDELEAVYVEATADQLTATLNGLQKTKTVDDVTLEPAVEVTMLDATRWPEYGRRAYYGRTETNRLVAARESLTKGTEEEPVAEAARKQDGKSIARAKLAKPGEPAPATVAAGNAGEPLVPSPLRYDARNRLALGSRSRQLNMVLPPVLLAERERLLARPNSQDETPVAEEEFSRNRSALEDRLRQQIRRRLAGKTFNLEQQQMNQRVPVLFVLEDATRAATEPATAGAVEKPANPRTTPKSDD